MEPAGSPSAQKAGPGLPDTADPVVDLSRQKRPPSLPGRRTCLGRHWTLSPHWWSPASTARSGIAFSSRASIETISGGWVFAAASVNNWNPWINSNWLACALLVDPIPARAARSRGEEHAAALTSS